MLNKPQRLRFIRRLDSNATGVRLQEKRNGGRRGREHPVEDEDVTQHLEAEAVNSLLGGI
jgi:hypothetical protein